MYTARELARAAGYLIRRVETGGVAERGYVLDVGPHATDAEIAAIARRHLVDDGKKRHASATVGPSTPLLAIVR